MRYFGELRGHSICELQCPLHILCITCLLACNFLLSLHITERRVLRPLGLICLIGGGKSGGRVGLLKYLQKLY